MSRLNRVSRRNFLVMSGITGLSLLAACGPRPAEPGQTPAPGQPTAQPAAGGASANTLVVGWGTGPNGLDFDFHHALRSLDVYRNCGLSPLMYGPKQVGEVYEPDFSKLLPMAAKEWTVAPDYKSITITLKEGIKSATGNELTADDVLWTFQRHQTVEGVSKGFEQNVLFLSSADNVKKEGTYTYTIHIDKPNALIAPIMAHVEAQILDSVEYKKHATTDDPWATKWSATNFAGHGPWKLTEYTPGQSWTFERNENYFDPGSVTSNLTKIVNRVIPSSPSRLAMLQAGSIDLAFDLEPAELKSLDNDPAVRVDHLAGNFVQYLGFTFGSDKCPQLRDLNVRKAIAAALPYDELVQKPYLGTALQMTSFVVPSYPGYDVVSQVWNARSQDLAKAKEYLGQSQWPNGFSTTLHYDAGAGGEEDCAIIIKSALAQIGINVELVKLQNADYMNLAYAVGGGFPGLFIYRDFAGTPDGLFSTGLFVVSDHCCSPGGYGNTEIDALYDEASKDPGNEQKRFDLQRQIEDIAWNKDPMGVPMQFLGFHAASRKNVGGWHWHSINEMIWQLAWKK